MSEPVPPILAYVSPAIRKRKPRVWSVYLLPLSLFCLIYAFAYAAGRFYYYYWFAGETPWARYVNSRALFHSVSFHLGYSASFMALEFGCLLLFLFFSRTTWKDRIALRRPQCSLISVLVFAIGAGALSTLSGMAIWDLNATSKSLNSFRYLFASASPLQLVGCYLITAIMAPILEEFIFRGYIQTRLVQRHGPLLGILIASLLFGIFHMDLVQGAYAFVMGLMQGTIAYRTRSILPAIACHMLVNADAVFETSRHVSGFPITLGMGIASVIILPASLWLLYRTNPPSAATAPALELIPLGTLFVEAPHSLQ